jgi:hypothetical protein
MRTPILLLAGLAILAGCGLNPTGRTASPSPSPLPEGITNLRAGETLEPGRYGFRDFGRPIVTFEVDGPPWEAVQLFDGFFDIQQDVDSPDVIAIQVARPSGIHGADGYEPPDDAEDAVAVISENPDLEVVETSESRIGGLDGSQVTVENAGSDVAPFMELPPGKIGINEGRRLWIAFFDTDEGLLAIMVGGSIERWDEALAAAEPVLETVEIGESVSQ